MLIPLLALTSLSAKPLNVCDFGADWGGTTLSTHAIQAAVDDAARTENRVVEFPAGRYLSGTIHLRSHVELHFDKGAILLGSPHRHDYDHGVWYSLLMASNVEDIALTGKGTVDGNGVAVSQNVLRLVRIGELKIPPKGWRPSEVDRTEVIEFTDCRNVRVEDITVKNSCCWVQTYRRCVGLSINREKVDSKTYWNNDGIDVVDCRNVNIANCNIDSNDDGICLKSERPDWMCDNVLVENCIVRSSASAIKFGTTSRGGFRNVTIRHIYVFDTFRSAVALESVDGGLLENVIIDGIYAKHTGNAFFIRLGHRNTKAPPGRICHVILRNFNVEIPAGRPDFGYPFHGPQFTEAHNLCPSSIVGHVQVPIEDVTLENIAIHFAGGGTTAIANVPLSLIGKVPERPTDYPEFTMFGELPAWGIYARHVRGLKMKNITVTLDKPDYRPAFVADDVSKLSTTGLKTEGADRKPTFVVRGGKKSNIKSSELAVIHVH